MASKFPDERGEKRQLRTRKGHDMTWSCDKHGEPIKFYCQDHTIPICHPCATKDHVKKQCELQDIEDVILEMRRELEDTQTKIAAAKKGMKTLRSKLESSETSASNHLQSVNDEVKATYDGKLKSVTDKERDEIRLINKKADEEIRIINEKRERQIKAIKEEAEKEQVIIKESEAKLSLDIKTINEKVKKTLSELKSKNQHNMNRVDNMDFKIERIKQDDKTLVNEAPRVIASLDESLSSNVHQEVADYLDRIESEVQRVKFVEGEVGGEHYGRIDGYIGKWELAKSIDIPSIIDKPRVCGLISDDEICVGDATNNVLYVTNISSEHTEKVIEGDSNIFHTYCAPLDSNVIVSGKFGGWCRGDILDGRITLYDRQWKVIRDITIPKNKSSMYHSVHVDVDRDGMILAAQYYQSNIYVINPVDGKIVNTITMKGKEVRGDIEAFSSGDIVVNTDDDECTVISRLGETKAVTHCGEWRRQASFYVDKPTDTLYITYWDILHDNIYAVDQVSCNGNIQARRIMEGKLSDRCLVISPCLVTRTGNHVTCDGEKLFVYKKSFIV